MTESRVPPTNRSLQFYGPHMSYWLGVRQRALFAVLVGVVVALVGLLLSMSAVSVGVVASVSFLAVALLPARRT